MKNIIVTVTDRQQRFMYDLEVPVDAPGRKLSEDVMEVLNTYGDDILLNADYHCLFLNRQGRVITDRETLAEAGVWNGDYITIISKV